jgi:malonate decarboxylase alpha subunit
MNAGQTPARSWNHAAAESAALASLPVQGKVIPTDGLVDALEN